MRTMLVGLLFMVAMVVAGCGADPSPGPGAVDGEDAGVDAAGDRPTGLTPRCISTGNLDCDGDGTCETSRTDRSNCGVCGRVCAPPRKCLGTGLCLM